MNPKSINIRSKLRLFNFPYIFAYNYESEAIEKHASCLFSPSSYAKLLSGY
jgi:hypothetical protein